MLGKNAAFDAENVRSNPVHGQVIGNVRASQAPCLILRGPGLCRTTAAPVRCGQRGSGTD